MERIVKVVLVSVPSIKGYNRHEWRTVECEAGQRGHLSERGIKVIYNSGPLYRAVTKSGRGIGPQCKAAAERAATEYLAAKHVPAEAKADATPSVACSM